MNQPRLTVLLIEDNPADIRLIREHFSECTPGAFSLKYRECLADGIELLEKEEINVILLDLSLPDSGGFETFLKVRDKYPQLPIIILTGFDNEALAVKAVKEGAQDYLSKGEVSSHLLARSVRYAVERKRTEEALRKAGDELEIKVTERTTELEKTNTELRREVAERLKAEESLRESEARYRAIVEDQTELIFRSLPDRTVTFVNHAFCRYFDRLEAEVLGASFLPFLVVDDREKAAEHLASLHAGNPMGTIELRVIKPDGTIRWQQWTNRLIVDADNVPGELQSVGRDVTEQKQMEEALQISSEQIKLFAYSVSHDLKSPAVSVHGLTKLLHKQYNLSLDERGAGYLEQILKSSEQIVSLAETINLYISTREVALLVERISLEGIVQIIQDEFAIRLSIRSIRWKVPQSLPEIYADRLALLRVLRNFVDNALKYGGNGLTEIAVGFEDSPTHHILSVRDDGIGIGVKDSEKIFNLFERKKETRNIEGSGLGLAIVKEIAEQHGGTVWAQPGPDKGSTFYISISNMLHREARP